MDNLQSIAMFIDADNTRLGKLEEVIREVSAFGRIVVKRAYGNWKKEVLKNWEQEIKRLAIHANQQFDYVSGKNATDMALTIDAMDMLYRGIYDAFVIVASDSDYTPLAVRIHESGVFVIGVGEKKTPTAFRNACDEFIFLENLGTKEDDPALIETPAAAMQIAEPSLPAAADSVSEDAETEEEAEASDIGIEKVHDLLKVASEKYEDEDGYTNVAAAGTFIKRTMPEFDARTYGYKKLPELIAAFPELYEIKRFQGKGTATIVAYRCLK